MGGLAMPQLANATLAVLLLSSLTFVKGKRDPLITFEGSNTSSQTWRTSDDSPMGGSSTVNFTVSSGMGVFSGVSRPLPTPKGAPGYLRAETMLSNAPALNGCEGLELVLGNASTSNYTGFRLAFGTDMYYSRQGYKAPLQVAGANGPNATSIKVPFTDFTRDWDDATGLPVIKCAHETSVCPTFLQLNNLQRVEISAEGGLGEFRLEIMYVGAYSCTTISSDDVDIEQATDPLMV